MPDHGPRVSVAEASRRLGAAPHYVVGLAEALGVRLHYFRPEDEAEPRRRTMSAEDFDRIKALLDDRLGSRRGYLGDNPKADGRAIRA